MIDWLQQEISRIIFAGVMPVYHVFTHGGRRFFWLYLLTGMAIAFYAYWKHKEAGRFHEELFSRENWLSRSAINDYIIVVVTPVLKVTILSGLAINWQPVSKAVVEALHGIGVSGHATDGTAVALGIALTIALFVADDFMRWYTHYLFHRIPELWEFHKVHHSAEVLTFATADRHHPVETLLTGAALTACYGIVNGLFIGFFGDQLTVTTIASANIFLFVFNVMGGALRHSPFWLSFGPRVERWLISPAMHHIHHSANERHFDKNLGGALAIWDRWAGTLHIPQGREIDHYGIGEETVDFRSLAVIYFRPFKSAFQSFRRRLVLIGSEARKANAEPANNLTVSKQN